MRNASDNIDFWLLFEAHHRGQHLTMLGNFVDCDSHDCAIDLQKRIEDAVHTRDLCTTRSDERTYYNGVLRVLRRRFREVEREIKKKDLPLTERKNARSRLRRMSDSNRALHLAGLL